jgi:hypothetical protein
MRLATPLRRSLFALPLLAIAVAALIPPRATPVLALQPLAEAPGCGPAEPVGALGLARVPGDLGGLGRRLRCAG